MLSEVNLSACLWQQAQDHAVYGLRQPRHATDLQLTKKLGGAVVTLSKLELLLNVVSLGYDAVWMDTDVVCTCFCMHTV